MKAEYPLLTEIVLHYLRYARLDTHKHLRLIILDILCLGAVVMQNIIFRLFFNGQHINQIHSHKSEADQKHIHSQSFNSLQSLPLVNHHLHPFGRDVTMLWCRSFGNSVVLEWINGQSEDPQVRLIELHPRGSIHRTHHTEILIDRPFALGPGLAFPQFVLAYIIDHPRFLPQKVFESSQSLDSYLADVRLIAKVTHKTSQRHTIIMRSSGLLLLSQLHSITREIQTHLFFLGQLCGNISQNLGHIHRIRCRGGHRIHDLAVLPHFVCGKVYFSLMLEIAGASQMLRTDCNIRLDVL